MTHRHYYYYYSTIITIIIISCSSSSSSSSISISSDSSNRSSLLSIFLCSYYRQIRCLKPGFHSNASACVWMETGLSVLSVSPSPTAASGLRTSWMGINACELQSHTCTAVRLLSALLSIVCRSRSLTGRRRRLVWSTARSSGAT